MTTENGSRRRYGLVPTALSWVLVVPTLVVLTALWGAVFHRALEIVTQTQAGFPWLLALLPFAAALTVALGAKLFPRGGDSLESLATEVRSDAMSEPRLSQGSFVLGGTLLTHLSGGSAGREGTAVQMGASLASLFTTFPTLSAYRPALLMAGMAGGLGAVFGTPIMAAVFALEICGLGRTSHRRPLDFPLCLLVSFAADGLARHAFGVSHVGYVVAPRLATDLTTWLALVPLAFVFALVVWTFRATHHAFGKALHRITGGRTVAAAFLGGALLALALAAPGAERYQGLGLSSIAHAFSGDVPLVDAPAKLLATALTLASGLKGGEITPLLFLGATAGNALGAVFDVFPHLPRLGTDLLAALGLVAVFGAGLRVPVAGACLALELFPTPVALVCVVCGFLTHGISQFLSPASPGGLTSRNPDGESNVERNEDRERVT